MHPRFSSASTCAMVALLTSGCASTACLAPPDVPAPLRVPAGQVAFFEALATGVQIYECAPKPDGSGVHEWTFRAPEAALADRSGRSLGTHYAGPTWASTDGSTVVAEVKARDAGPSTSAIPWLLLATTRTTGTGLLSRTASIQRVQTAGGVAPVKPCGLANARELARVPYTATYYFYSAAP